MQPIQINVSVNIGVTDGLLALLSTMLNRPQAEATAAPAETVPAPKKPRASKQQPVVENPEPQPETEAKTEAPAPQLETKPEPQPEVAAPAETAPVTEQAQEKECTEEDVREAIHRVRKRIEGENYKEKPDSELYQKWHRRLTGWFKQVALQFGSDKPSTLPDSESRAKFIKCCDAVYVKDDELTEDCPF